MLITDPIALNIKKQALKDHIRQQATAEYRDCPFFAINRRASGSAGETHTSFPLAQTINARIFTMASASALHRQALFSAAIKYLAFLHCREAEGVLAWALNAQVLPASWRVTEAELEQPVKRLFGAELAYWKQAAELTAGLPPQAVQDELSPPPEVLVAYSERGEPFEGVTLSGYALCIGIEAGPEETRLHLRFPANQGDAELAALLADRLTLLLNGMVFEPGAALGTMAWFPQAEQDRVAALSAVAPSRPLAYRNVARAIAASLRERAGTRFLECGEQSVDFAQLGRYTDRLLSDPAWPQWEALGDCVLIIGPKGVETTLAAMACMRIGKPFCLQPDTLQPAQLADLAALHQTRVVLLAESRRDLTAFFGEQGCQVMVLPSYEASLSAESVPAPADCLAKGEAIEPDAALCVVMTSGSEGKPKGCIATHRALINLAQEKQALYGPGHSRVGSMANHGFDYFVLECVEAVMLDITLVMVPEDARIDPAKSVAFLREQAIDQLFATTVLAEDIMAQGDVPTLRQLFFGGESLRSFQKNNYELFNVYGPSETGVLTTYSKILSDEQPINIGRPFGGYQCVVVFPGSAEPCPVGVAGELLIGGVGVGLGYLNRPDLTEKTFIELDTDRFQGRYYRSGDLCCWNAAGELEIQGRRDRQLKVNGFRVELDAIEKHARDLPDVAQAAVVGLTDQRGHARLGALIVPADEGLTEQAVRDALSSRMPAYMVPGQIALVPALPLTRNGKLDRQRLKALFDEAGNGAIVPPSGATQEWLAACWARQLELDAGALSADRSFFALGGHSLRAARMLAELEQAFGLSVSLLEFFRNDTIAGLAQLVDARQGGDADASADTFAGLLDSVSTDARDRGPLSAQEARLYAQYRLYPESLAYLLVMDIPLPDAVNAEAVGQALQGLLARHDILRTRYRLDRDGSPYAEVQPAIALDQILLGQDAWQRVHAQPFDLEQGPLLRGCLLAEPDGTRLRLQVHHILVDEPAMALLRQEFEQLLRGETLPPAGPGYRHYAAALSEARQQPLWAPAQAFWRQYLDGLEFDPFGHGAVDAGDQMTSVSWQLSAEELAQAKRLCADLNVTPAAFFLALWGLAVAREGVSNAFSISVANAYRPRQALSTVGMFVSLAPCAFRFGQSERTFDGYVRQLADEQWRVMEQLFFPVEEVFPLLERDPRRFGSNPLLNIAYSYLETAGEEATERPDFEVEAQGPLSLAIAQSGQGCRLALEYQRAAFSDARIAAIAACYRDALQQALGQAPAAWRVDDWVAAAAPFRPAPLRESYAQIADILRRNFLALSEQPAVIDDAGEVSWREFAALTAAYAERLNHRTVRRALILGRTGRRMQAFLAACFLTRTSYLALESGTPEARVEEVLRHAAPEVVIDAERETATPAAIDWSAFQSEKSYDDNPIAWILYSSGTTGRPKGICVAARTVAQYLDSLIGRLQLRTGMRIVQQFSPSFDGYLEEVLLAWALQGTSVVADRYSLLDERKARDFLASRRPDVISAAPALLSAWNRMPDLRPLPGVCISGGDFLAPGDIANLREHMQIWNSYGPTETCIAASMVNCAELEPGAMLPIGSPFAHVAFSVIGADGRRLRPGQWGELAIYGDFGLHGYLDDAIKTAEKFGSDEHGAFFRTGDMAMAGKDGLFYLKGRMDDSCKVRGNFIGLGELEGHAGQCPGVAAAGAAVAWAGTPEACLVLAIEGEPESLAGLQQHLARHYPRSHLPSAIFPVERLPRTDTGKLDRNRLVALFHDWRERGQPESDDGAVDEALLELIACWRDCLGYQGPLTADSDFFLVSGSSLSAVRLAGQLETRFGVVFSPVDIFRNTTVAAQWALITARRCTDGSGSGVLLQERFLGADQPGTPKLVLLPPALGGLVELQALADGWAGQVTTSVLALAPEAAVELSVPMLEAALLNALKSLLAASDRPLWLGGYSLGAEMLAALLERHPELARGVERVVLLDPNLQTEVFDGPALYAEFRDFFRDLGDEAGLDEIDEAGLRERFPALYREWCHYRLQHRFLAGRPFLARTEALAALAPPVALFLSEDAQPHAITARLGIVRRLRGNHSDFLRRLDPDVLASLTAE